MGHLHGFQLMIVFLKPKVIFRPPPTPSLQKQYRQQEDVQRKKKSPLSSSGCEERGGEESKQQQREIDCDLRLTPTESGGCNKMRGWIGWIYHSLIPDWLD